MGIRQFAVALPTEPLIFQPAELWVHDRIVNSDWRQMLPVLHDKLHLSESLEGWEGIIGGPGH